MAWLTEFFEYSKRLAARDGIAVRTLPEMHMLRVPCQGDDSMYAMDMELRRVAATPACQACHRLNPTANSRDIDHLRKNEP